MDDRDCIAFLQWALPQQELRWPNFRKVRRQVCKRLTQRIGELGLDGFAAYRRRLEADPAEWRAFDECCYITISRFFRDKGVFEVLRKRVPKAAVAGIDLLPTEPIEGVTILQLDFMADEAPAALAEALGGAPDLVLSDMAANTVGHKQTDHLRTMGLVEAAAAFAVETLAPGGAFVAKVLAGGTDSELLALLKQHFRTVKHAKPPASRKGSSEWYVIAQGFKGRG